MESKKLDPVRKSFDHEIARAVTNSVMLMSRMKVYTPSKLSYSVSFGTTKKTKLREKAFIKTMIKAEFV